MLLASDISMAFAGLVSSPQRSVGCKSLWMAEDRLLVIPSLSLLRNIFTFSFFFAVLVQQAATSLTQNHISLGRCFRVRAAILKGLDRA